MTWTHDCGVDGCLVNLEEDPTEHNDIATDPSNTALRERLLALLKTFNENIFAPDRGEDSTLACAAAFRNGGYYGPFVDFQSDGMSVVANDEGGMGLWHRIQMALYRWVGSQADRLAHVYQMLLPKVSPFIVRKWEICDPNQDATGVQNGAIKLDSIIIPLLVTYALRVEIVTICVVGFLSCCCYNKRKLPCIC